MNAGVRYRRSGGWSHARIGSGLHDALLEGGRVLDGFRALLRRPEAVHLIDLDALLARVEAIAPPELETWAAALSARYRAI